MDHLETMGRKTGNSLRYQIWLLQHDVRARKFDEDRAIVDGGVHALDLIQRSLLYVTHQMSSIIPRDG